MRIDRSDDGDVSGPHPDAADTDRTRRAGQGDAGGANRADRAAAVPAESPAQQAVRQAARVEYYARADAVFRAYAVDQGYAKIEEIEEKVTPAMRRIEAADPDRRLAGLDHRLKGKDRLTEKVEKSMDAQPDLRLDQALSLVKDAIRYTFLYDDADYAAGVYADCERLKSAGFQPNDMGFRCLTGRG